MREIVLNEKNKKKKVKSNENKINKGLLLNVLVILAFGTIMIISASMPYALAHYGDAFFYVKRQIVFLVLGIIVMFVLSKISDAFYKKIAPWFYLMCVGLLVVVLFGGFSEGVAKRWLGIPGTPLSFQPSELMKLGIILMLAWWTDRMKENKKSILNETILPGVFLFGACALVLLEKHLSGTIILAMIGITILFVSGASIKRMVLFYGLTGIAGGATFLLTNDYAMKRIESFLNPNADILSDKWQTTQGLYAIGSGGLWGNGLGNSVQKYSYVSEPQNDFIFTIWCEEMGYIGAISLIVMFLFLLIKGYKIAFNSNNVFSSLVAFGITSQIGIQAFLNMLVVSDLIPNTGVSLPFFSYGGSSLVILLAEVGILLSISRKANVR